MVTLSTLFLEYFTVDRHYGSDIYRQSRRPYDEHVVWQFWGRAARAPWVERLRVLFYSSPFFVGIPV